MTRFLGLVLGIFIGFQGLWAQQWKPVVPGTIPASQERFHEPMPRKYILMQTDLRTALQRAENAPFENENGPAVDLMIPVDARGTVERFETHRVRYMEDGLARRYPQLFTLLGKSKSGKVLHVSVSPYEVNMIVTRPGKPTFLLKPYAENTWIGYSIDQQHFTDEGFRCDVADVEGETPSFDENMLQRPAFNDGTLRKYRYAPSITGEYSQYTLNRLGIPSSASDADKKTAVLGAVQAAVTRINSVYEKDMAIRLILVNNEDQVIYLDPSTDPFDNSASNMSGLLNQNQTTVNTQIGSANYDVSQVWCQGNLQGLAQLGVVCSGMKGRGAIRGQQPETDRYIISVACHEMGHQFGANHTFSNSNCGGSRHDATAVETGSGTTIMSYAGICPPDVQNWTDDRFNYVAIKEFRNNINNNGTGSCSVNEPVGHSAPSINAGVDKYIPKETPFMLSASVSDADGDPVTLVWDEEDAPQSSHSITTTPQPTWTDGPMFRPYPERDTTVRFFPKLETLLAGQTSSTWEVLPSVTRLLTFNVTARDNHPGKGQTANDVIYLGVRDDAGPFRITSQQTTEAWQPGQQVNVTWDVAGTDQGYINCSTVDIIASYDAGLHFTDTLAAGVPNNGSTTFTVPNVNSANARIMVKARDNYFLSINPARITIGNYTQQCGNQHTHAPAISIPDNNSAGITDTIHVSENQYISDVNVHVNITHSYVRDLQIKLIAPDGTQVMLWNHNCGGQDNLVLTFDDDGNNIDCSQLTGNIQPVENLSVLNDKYSAGDWILAINDNAAPDQGTLNDWALEFCYLVDVKNYGITGVKVYPNPSDGQFNIRFPLKYHQPVSVQITDLSGRVVYSKNFEPVPGPVFEQKITTGQLSKGSYILRINQNQYYWNQMIQIK